MPQKLFRNSLENVFQTNEGDLFGQLLQCPLIWRHICNFFFNSSLTLTAHTSFPHWCSLVLWFHRLAVPGYSQNKECCGGTSQTKRGSWSFLHSNLSESEFVGETGKPRLRLERLERPRTSARRFKPQRFISLLEYFPPPQASRDLRASEAKQNSYLALSKAKRLFQPRCILASVTAQAHSSRAGCRAPAIETIP